MIEQPVITFSLHLMEKFNSFLLLQKNTNIQSYCQPPYPDIKYRYLRKQKRLNDSLVANKIKAISKKNTKVMTFL